MFIKFLREQFVNTFLKFAKLFCSVQDNVLFEFKCRYIYRNAKKTYPNYLMEFFGINNVFRREIYIKTVLRSNVTQMTNYCN